MTTREEVIAAAKEAGFIYYSEFPNDYKCKLERFYAIAFQNGAASRDAEVAELKLSSDTYFTERNSARDAWSGASKERDQLRNDVKVLLEALESMVIHATRKHLVRLKQRKKHSPQRMKKHDEL